MSYNRLRIPVVVGVGVGSLLVLSWLYTGVAWPYLLTLSRGALESSPLLFLLVGALLVMLPACLIAATVFLLFSGVPEILAWSEAAAYSLLLLASIMLKSPGKRGLNLNPLQIVDELEASSPTLVLNLVLFMPLGMFFHRWLTSSVTAHMAIVSTLCAMETFQYALSLGIADINNVLVNYLGILLGMLLVQLLHRMGVAGTRKAGRYYIVQPERNE